MYGKKSSNSLQPIDPTEWDSSTAAESVCTPTDTEEFSRKPSHTGTRLSVLHGSRIATASYQDSKGRHLCVYWQDENGIIRESLYLRDQEVQHWKLTKCIFVSDGAKLESPLAVAVWANGIERRLYYLDRANLIKEAECINGFSWGTRLFSWNEGRSGLASLKIPTHAQSGLAAGHHRTGVDELWIRVFYQDEYLQLQEVRFESHQHKWVHGSNNLPHALPGSTLAFGAHTDSAYLHLFYQKQDGQPADIYYMPLWILNPLYMWYHGGYNPGGKFPDRTAIACIIRTGHLRIFAHRGNGVISDTLWQPLQWGPTNDLHIQNSNTRVSHFVALEWTDSGILEECQQHIVGINTADNKFWDYVIGVKQVESQELF